jgi:hypothetical protein
MDHNKEKITHQEMRNLIHKLNLSQGISDLFDGNCTDRIMQQHFFDKSYSDPYMVLSLEKFQQDVYAADRYKPILAYSGATVFAYDSVLKGFISYDIESAVTPVQSCLSWDGLFIPEILRWWEYEVSDENILHIGRYFGLKHTQEILDSIYETTDGEGFSTGKAIAEWENAMIVKINGRVT